MLSPLSFIKPSCNVTRHEIKYTRPCARSAASDFENPRPKCRVPRMCVGQAKSSHAIIMTSTLIDSGFARSLLHSKTIKHLSSLRCIDPRAIQRINMMTVKYVLACLVALFCAVNANALGGAHKSAAPISGVSGVSSAVSGVSSTSGKAGKGEHLLKALDGLNGMLADLNDKVTAIRDNLPEYNMEFKKKHSKGVSGTSGTSGVSAGGNRKMWHN